MNRKPLVSVIVAVSNCAEYLAECLDSVLTQTFTEIEVIVADVLSNDGTEDLIYDYVRFDDRVVCLADDFGSIGRAKNMAVERASAPYIMLVEPCDRLPNDAIERLYSEIKDNAELDLVLGLTEGLEDGEVVRPGKGEGAMLLWMMFECEGLYRKDFLRQGGIRNYEEPGFGTQGLAVRFLAPLYARTLVIHDAVYRRRDVPQALVNNPKAVFDICTEYGFIEKKLRGNPEKWEKYKRIFYQAYFSSGLDMYGRLSPCLRPGLSARLHDDMKSAIRAGDFGREFFAEETRSALEQLLDSPERFDEEWGKEEWNRQVESARELVRLEDMEAETAGVDEASGGMEGLSRRRIDRRWLTDEMTRDLVPLRMLLGASADEMCEILGVSGSTYKSMESGKRKMSWNQYLTLLFMFHYNDRTEFIVDNLGLYPQPLKDRIASDL